MSIRRNLWIVFTLTTMLAVIPIGMTPEQSDGGSSPARASSLPAMTPTATASTSPNRGQVRHERSGRRVLPRSSVDRKGPNTWDVKFVYVTFRKGPDSHRDTNGEIAQLATDVGRYFAQQRPGYGIRVDKFRGALDIQHVELPITIEKYLEVFKTRDNNLVQIFADAFEAAGLPMPDPVEGWGNNTRMYAATIEGPRGVKFAWGEPHPYECGRLSELEVLGIVSVLLRTTSGELCWFAANGLHAQGKDPVWWGGSILTSLVYDLRALPGCSDVFTSEFANGPDERLEAVVSPKDILARPDRQTDSQLDPTHNRYFLISKGPYVGDRCRDIQYSPYWHQKWTEKPATARPVGRATADRPDDIEGPQIKVFYVVPRNGIDVQLDLRIGSIAPTLNAWLKNQTGKTLRWDTYKGKLDVTFVRLRQTEAELWHQAADDPACWDRPCPNPGSLHAELMSLGLVKPETMSVILYAGRPSPVFTTRSGCGASNRSVITWTAGGTLPFETPKDGSAWSLGLCLFHEILHAHGVVDGRAPHSDGAGHIVSTDPSDVMAIGTSPKAWKIDPGRDDYWGHAGDWPDVSKSVFFDPLAPDAALPEGWNR